MRSILKSLLSALLALSLCLPTTLPVSAAGGMPTAAAGNYSVLAGGDLEVKISLANNPGIASMRLFLAFDDSALELLSAAIEPAFSGAPNAQSAVNIANPAVLNWLVVTGQVQTSGVFATLRFHARADVVPGDYSLTLSCDPSDLVNENLVPVAFQISSGTVTVHALTHVPAVVPGCTAGGSIEYWRCQGCGKLFRDANAEEEIALEDTDVPAVGHSYGAPVWQWAADYSSASAVFTCAKGDDTQTVTTTVSSKTTQPTHEQTGKTVYTATAVFMGITYTETAEVILPTTDHVWGEWETVIEPRFHQEGLERRVCQLNSSHVETRAIPALTQEELEWTVVASGKQAIIRLQGQSETQGRVIVATYAANGQLLTMVMGDEIENGSSELTISIADAEKLVCFAIWSEGETIPMAPSFTQKI